jgi:hypothetical protein
MLLGAVIALVAEQALGSALNFVIRSFACNVTPKPLRKEVEEQPQGAVGKLHGVVGWTPLVDVVIEDVLCVFDVRVVGDAFPAVFGYVVKGVDAFTTT